MIRLQVWVAAAVLRVICRCVLQTVLHFASGARCLHLAGTSCREGVCVKESTHTLTAVSVRVSSKRLHRHRTARLSHAERPQNNKMQLRRVIVALALAAGAAFTPPTRRHAMQPLRAADEVCGECDPMSPFSDGCRPCADGRSVFVGDTKVTSKTLRTLTSSPPTAIACGWTTSWAERRPSWSSSATWDDPTAGTTRTRGAAQLI